MELSFITLPVLVLLATQSTNAVQIGPIVGDQDLNNEADVSEATHADHYTPSHEIFLFGQRIRTQIGPTADNELTVNGEWGKQSDINLPETIPCQFSTIAKAAAASNDIVNQRNDQLNLKRRRLSDDVVSLTPHQFVFNSDTYGVHVSKMTNHGSSSKVEDGPELDLNQKSIERNYEELCRLIGKEQDADEVSFLKRATPSRRPNSGRKTYPITIEFNGDQIYLTEWSQTRSAKNTLVKLILVARFCQKLDPIWSSLNSLQKTEALKHQYNCARRIMLCVTVCCESNLIKFQQGRGNPFCHYKFQGQRCPDHNAFDKNNQMLHVDTDLNVEDLNLRTIDVNYRDLCKLIGKQEDVTELQRLKPLVPSWRCYNNGPKADSVAVWIWIWIWIFLVR